MLIHEVDDAQRNTKAWTSALSQIKHKARIANRILPECGGGHAVVGQELFDLGEEWFFEHAPII